MKKLIMNLSEGRSFFKKKPAYEIYQCDWSSDVCSSDLLRPQLAGVDRLQVEEERLDHVLRGLVDDQVRQVARLDPRGGVEVERRPLDRGGQDRPRRLVDRTLGLLAQEGRERRQEAGEGRRRRRASRHLVAGLVPGGLA